MTVLSGKGGTGKTTVTAALIQLFGRVVTADCDVEAPNLHLLLEHEVEKSYSLSVSSKAVIDADLCTRCGLCEEKCRFEAVRDFTVDAYSCEGCGLCARICPEGAVRMVERDGAEVFLARTPYGPMVWAKLEVGEEASGKVVSQVRMEAQVMSVEGGPELVVVDGSPGIGCPVIASVTGSDLVLMVAEPTMSGRHDLLRAIRTASHFGIPSLVCINKCDVNREEAAAIRKECEALGVEVAVEIPYCEELVEAVMQSRPPLEYAGRETAGLFEVLHGKVADKLGVAG